MRKKLTVTKAAAVARRRRKWRTKIFIATKQVERTSDKSIGN